MHGDELGEVEPFHFVQAMALELAQGARSGFFSEFYGFLRDNKKWGLWPMPGGLRLPGAVRGWRAGGMGADESPSVRDPRGLGPPPA